MTTREGGHYDLWFYDISRGTRTRLTFEESSEQIFNPIWTPDSSRVTFRSLRERPLNLFWIPSDFTGKEERLTASVNLQLPNSWSPNGKVLAFSERSHGTGWDIWMLPVGEERKPWSFLQGPYHEAGAMFSPDGRWVAYVSNESGRSQVYVRPFRGPGGKVLISTDGGYYPRWASDGTELFYRSGNQMLAVEVATKPTFRAHKPRVLFEGQYSRDYDVDSDGQRLMVKEGRSAPTQLNVVLNWFDELNRLAPAN